MTVGANTVPQLAPPWTVLLVLLVIFALSVTMFVALVRRWTHSRAWVTISDWTRARGYRASVKDCPAPPPLDALRGAQLRSQMCVSDGRTSLLRLDVLGGDASSPARSKPTQRWHVLVRRIESPWKPSGLRPAGASSSLLDLFSLTSFPLMGATYRFVVYGTDSAPARRLSKSRARALLPPDVGLLLHGHHLILDFTARPFDEIEFDRMIALSEQLVTNLPTPG